MTSSRSESVQHAIDSAIASRSVDVQSYLNSSRTPILEQADPEPSLNDITVNTTATEFEQGDQSLSSDTAPIRDPFAPAAGAATAAAVTTAYAASNPFDGAAPISENEPNLQKDTGFSDQGVINAPITNVHGNLEEANLVVVPGANDISTGLDQTPAGDALAQETPELSDNVQCAIQSAVNAGGIDSQSFIGNTTTPLAAAEEDVPPAHDITASNDTGISSTDATFGDIGQSLDKKLSGNDGVDSAVDSSITAPAAYTEFPSTQGITADNDTGIPSANVTFGEIDQNNGDKFSANDTIENAIDSAVAAPAAELDVPSTHATTVGNDTGIPSTGATFGEADHSLGDKFSGNDAVESAVNSAIAAPAAEVDLPSTHNKTIGNDTGIPSTDATFGETDQSLGDKIDDSDTIGSAVSAPDASDGVHEPLHSETDSAKNVDPSAPATADLGNEVDNALENAVEAPTGCFDGSATAQEDAQPTPPLPPKESELEEEQHKTSVLDKVKDKASDLKDNIKETVGGQNTDDGENDGQGMKDSVKTTAAAVGASATAATAGIASFASDKKDKLKAKIDEKKDHAKNNEEEQETPVVGDVEEPFSDNAVDVPSKTVGAEDRAVIDTPSNVVSSDVDGAPAALGILNESEDPFKLNEPPVSVPEADVSDQTVPLSEHIDSKPPAPEPAQFKPVPPEPTEIDPNQFKPVPPEPTEIELDQYKPTPPEPVANIKPPIQSELTAPEPVAPEPVAPAPVTSEPITPEPTAPQPIASDFKVPEPATPPKPPSKHHRHHILHSNNNNDEKSKKCLIM